MISHAEDPSTLRPQIDRERRKFRSELEKGVYLGLLEAGYRIIQQYMVGECVIDLVVENDTGTHVAIQCDGDRTQTMEAVAEELAQQQMLRRLGWDFIRVRGSEYFQNPAGALKKLQRRLGELEISPAGKTKNHKPDNTASGSKDTDEPLHKRVIKRADSIRTRWKDVPNVPTVPTDPSVPTPIAAGKTDANGSDTEPAPDREAG